MQMSEQIIVPEYTKKLLIALSQKTAFGRLLHVVKPIAEI
jgi:hypothetical protein